MDLNEVIARNIRLAREQTGWGQAKLAEQLGFASHSAISDIESCKRRVTATELAAFAELFAKPFDWFFDPNASREDFVALARAQDQSDSAKRALREAERLFENFLLLESVLKPTKRAQSRHGIGQHQPSRPSR